MDYMEKCIHLMRKQRHDFMNDIQILYGYLQMGRYENALEYVENMSKENEHISAVYSLEDNYFGFCIENNVRKLRQKSIKVEVDIEIDKFCKKVFEEEYSKKSNLVNNIFSKFEDGTSNSVYVYIFEDILGQSLLICNSESVVDEIAWMESWDILDSSIEDISLYKCSYGDNIGYRITFK